ncbi:MAG: TylF/MycF family methyltransferase [Proteobacteria bacterium]|nr:TylF/MycF family methyltransferase [Pseudomonadota bacterium]
MEGFIQEILNRVVLARLSQKRVVFWGVNEMVLIAFQKENVCVGLDYRIISESKDEQGQFILDRQIEGPEAIEEFKPEEVIILSFIRKETVSSYEKLVRVYGVSPRIVFMGSKFWETRSHISDPDYWRCHSDVPDHLSCNLSGDVPIHLYEGLKYIMTRKIKGNIIHFGVSQGWAIYFTALILDHFEGSTRKVIGYDTAGEVSCAADKAVDQSMKTPHEVLKKNLQDIKNISLVPGGIQQSINEMSDEPVAMVVFDLNDYTSVQCALAAVYDRLSSTGVIMMEHFEYFTLNGGTHFGQRLAALEFMDTHPMFHITGTGLFLKM